jgi:uncharacterized membrane protein
MPAHLIDAFALLARWAHVVLAVAWLGAALYFAGRERSEPSNDPTRPGEHLVMWQAYWTWLTGFALLVLVYYVDADLYLVDPSVLPLSKWAAIGASLAVLVAAVAVYEALCRTPLRDPVLGGALLAVAAALAWGLTQIFSGRAAFVHYGAALGTIMSANVAHVTVPSRRRIERALRERRAPPAADVMRIRQRLAHNAWLVPGVVFAMVSSHFPSAFSHRWSWLLLAGATVVGVLAHGGWRQRSLAAACAVALALLAVPRETRSPAGVGLGEVLPVIEQRCAACHAERPSFPGIAEAPKGVRLDTPERVAAQAAQIRSQAAASRAMPPGNVTRMTESERALLERWSGAAR